MQSVQNQQSEKRPYVRPELAKLGNVEISTQGNLGGINCSTTVD